MEEILSICQVCPICLICAQRLPTEKYTQLTNLIEKETFYGRGSRIVTERVKVSLKCASCDKNYLLLYPLSENGISSKKRELYFELLGSSVPQMETSVKVDHF